MFTSLTMPLPANLMSLMISEAKTSLEIMNAKSRETLGNLEIGFIFAIVTFAFNNASRFISNTTTGNLPKSKSL